MHFKWGGKMKKILCFGINFILSTIIFFCVSGCSKAFGKTSSGSTDSAPMAFSTTENAVDNPELEKLDSVLSNMSERFLATFSIPQGGEEIFLADLRKVLESEKDFSSDDISPFFLVDKKNFLPENYVPKNMISLKKNDLYAITKNTLALRKEAYDALNRLAAAAKADGVTLTVGSTYRSYEYQKNLFDYWVRVDGLEEAERESSRPGTSQHQLGLVLDFAPIEDEFAETKAGKWAEKNAAKYGWSLSFPKGYEDVTGYRWESWHFRYVGIPAVQFQAKYFGDVQQFMIEFINAWKHWEN